MSDERRKVEWSLDLENMRVRAGQVVTDLTGGTAEVKRATLREARAGARSAQITIEFTVGRASIAALAADSADLFQAQISYVGDYEYRVSGDAKRVIALRQKGNSRQNLAATASKAQDLRWDIALAPAVPLALKLKGGVGEAELNLSQLLVDALQLESGMGAVALTLPQQEGRLAADIKAGVGSTTITIPEGFAGELHIAGGVGEVAVLVSRQAAVRLQVKSGLGKFDLPDDFNQVTGRKSVAHKGIWESPNYPDARRQILVDYSGGIGRFSLKYPEES